MIIFILILLIVIIITLLIIKYYNYENFENIDKTKINPVVQLAEETIKLNAVKKENKEITDITQKLQLVKIELEKKIQELNNVIKEKNNEKNKIETEIIDINTQRSHIYSVFAILKKKLKDVIKKEMDLQDKENELNIKKEEIDNVFEIKNKQDFDNILDKLNNISKQFTDNFCTTTKEMPKPIFKKYSEKDNDIDLSYKWCLCNDNNKKSDNCDNYIKCKNNYLNNYEKQLLNSEDLDIYFKCTDLYSDFPKYINKSL